MTTPDKIPYMGHSSVAGNGVSAQRSQMPVAGKVRRGKDISSMIFDKAMKEGIGGTGTRGLSAPFPY